LTREPDFNELVGEDVPAAETDRLRRAHDLLLAAGPLPELPPGLAEPNVGEQRTRRDENVYQLLPKRRTGAALALAAAIALIAFLGGYLSGYRHNGFTAQYSVPMHASAGLGGYAQIKIGERDSHGNLPLRLEIKGLPKLNAGYYEMYLTRGKRLWTCGTFTAGGQNIVKVSLTIPYQLRNGDGWIVTKELPGRSTPGPTVLTT